MMQCGNDVSPAGMQNKKIDNFLTLLMFKEYQMVYGALKNTSHQGSVF